MRVILKIVVLIGLSALPFIGAAKEEKSFPGVEVLMTSEEQIETGVSKLTEAERSALNDWLIRYTVTDAKIIRRTNPEVVKAEQDTKILANIERPFDGWTGKTIFHLDNGQSWRQRMSGKYRFKGDSTAVVIKKNLFGFYVMTLTETGRSIGVKPL